MRLGVNVSLYFVDLLPRDLYFRVIQRYLRTRFMLTFASLRIFFNLRREAIKGFTFRPNFIRIVNNLYRFRRRLFIRIFLFRTKLRRLNFNNARLVASLTRVRGQSTRIRRSKRATFIRRRLIIRFGTICVVVEPRSTSFKWRLTAIRPRLLPNSLSLFVRSNVFKANASVKGLSVRPLFSHQVVTKGASVKSGQFPSRVTGVRDHRPRNILDFASKRFTFIRLRLRFRSVILQFRTVFMDTLSVQRGFPRRDIVFVHRLFRLLYLRSRNVNFIYFRSRFHHHRHLIRLNRLFPRSERPMNDPSLATRVGQLLSPSSTRMSYPSFVVRVSAKRVNVGTYQSRIPNYVVRGGKRFTAFGSRSTIHHAMGTRPIDNGIQRRVPFVTFRHMRNAFNLFRQYHRFLVVLRHRFPTLLRTRHLLYRGEQQTRGERRSGECFLRRSAYLV